MLTKLSHRDLSRAQEVYFVKKRAEFGSYETDFQNESLGFFLYASIEVLRLVIKYCMHNRLLIHLTGSRSVVKNGLLHFPYCQRPMLHTFRDNSHEAFIYYKLLSIYPKLHFAG